MAITVIGFSDNFQRALPGTLLVDLPDDEDDAPLYDPGDLLILAARVNDWPADGTISIPGWIFFDGVTLPDTHHSVDARWEIWTRVATGSDAATMTLTGDLLAVEAMTVAVRGAATPRILGFDAAVGDQDDPIQPRGTRLSASGVFIGFCASDNGDNTPTRIDPSDWPCVKYAPGAVFGQNGWCSGTLAGPAATEDTPVTFVPNSDVRAASWLTLWVDEGASSPPVSCPVEAVGGSSEGTFTTEDTRPGFCSTDPADYAVLSADDDDLTFNFTLTAGQAAALNAGVDGAGFYLRGFILTDDDYNPAIVVGENQLSVSINGSGFGGGTTLGLTEIPASDAPDPSDWQTTLTPFAGDWVTGANTFTIKLLDASLEYNPGQFSTLSVYLDLVLIAMCAPVDVDGCPSCECGSVPVESDAEQCVTVLDFPTSTGGTISGRPNLLCATYGVMIIDRRNRATVLRLPEVGWDLTYGRRVDRTSDAELTVYAGQGPNGRGGVDDACCGALGKAGEWMHELVIWREGNPQEVWGGPITGVRDQLGQGVWSCTAHDRSIWFDERALPYDLVYAGNRQQDAARVFTDLVRAADQPRSYRGMSNVGGQVLPYDPIGLELFAYPTGVMIDQKILLRSDDVLIGPEIRSLGDSVIDWCVVGRRMYAGALVLNLDPIPILTTDHWLEQDPEIDRQGIGVATKVVVRGAGDVRGEYPPGQVTHPRWDQYGSHFKLIKDSTITDNQVATSRARTYWERWQQPNFTVISNTGTLGPKAPVTVEDLIPGRALQIAVLAGCMPTSLRLGESRVGGRTFFAYDSGQVQPLIVPQRLQELSVRVEDSVETEVRIDTQALGTDVRTRGQINYSNAGIGEG